MVRLVPSDVILMAPYIFLYTSGTVAEVVPPFVFPVVGVVPVASFLQEALIKIKEEKMIIYFILVIYGLVEVVIYGLLEEEVRDVPLEEEAHDVHLVVDRGDLLEEMDRDDRLEVAHHDF